MSERFNSLQNWLEELFKTSNFELTPASEDASFRSYFRVSVEGKTFIVMDAPPEYEDCGPFISITNKLQNSGINVPEIHNKDISKGFLLLTDFGNDLYLQNLNSCSADKLYKDAIDTLVQMQTDTDTSGLSFYDDVLLRREMNLFTDWLIQQHLQIDLSSRQLKEIETVFDLLVENALEQPQVFVHRDFHSRNLMLTNEGNPGVIDYQDAVIGPLSYDLVSLLKDCYIKWSADELNTWVGLYLKGLAIGNQGLNIDIKQFQRWFDLMGVQRHLKASGIFARLSHRDNKHGFLKDIPRTLSYICDLNHSYPELDTLNKIIKESVLPKFEGA